MAKGKCTGVILNFGPGGIEEIRKRMCIAYAEIVLRESEHKLDITAEELGVKAYNRCEFKEFDDEDGFYKIQEYTEERS